MGRSESRPRPTARRSGRTRVAATPAEVGRTQNAPRARDGHEPALDGLRGIAILSVMSFHFVAYTPRPSSFVSRGLYDALLGGWAGVDLFFVLSGFLITGILLDARGAPNYFRNFYVRRGLRIFPLYYAVLVVLLVLLPRLAPEAEGTHTLAAHGGAWYWGYLVNVLVAIHGWRAAAFDTGHLWSLAVEEQFYLFWPFVVFSASRRTLSRVCIGLLIAAPVLRVIAMLSGAPPNASYVLLPTRADALAAGALVALAVRSPNGLAVMARWRWTAIAAAAGVVAAVFFAARGFDFEAPLVQLVGYSSLALLASALVVAALAAPHDGVLRRVLSSTTLRWFGRYSYAMYLFHHALRGRLWKLFAPVLVDAGGVSWPARVVFVVAGIGVSAAGAALSWRLIERPFLQLKRYFPLAAAPPTASAPTRRVRRAP